MVAILAGLLTAWWPALQASRFNLVESLKEGSAAAGSSRLRQRGCGKDNAGERGGGADQGAQTGRRDLQCARLCHASARPPQSRTQAANRCRVGTPHPLDRRFVVLAEVAERLRVLSRPVDAARLTTPPDPVPGNQLLPKTKYARSDDVLIAYQVTGDGPVDVVMAPGTMSHLDLDWESPPRASFFEGLSKFCRLIRFDKRGTGLSDRLGSMPDLETRMDDVRAVMEIGRASCRERVSSPV